VSASSKPSTRRRAVRCAVDGRQSIIDRHCCRNLGGTGRGFRRSGAGCRHFWFEDLDE
jgi:hypothetical protein